MKTLLLALALGLSVHAGVKSTSVDPGYSFGYGATLTFGQKPKRAERLFDPPVFYNYNLNCPFGTFPALNKRTARWACAYY